ncbi:MAG TPA: methyltransferase domain-containing protein [Nitriliruptorales bacterium]|nr:methyltransferase domain-containing protein [Nitriliruptorales bacterium]
MSRLRAAVKSLAYSGLMRDRWQRPDEVLAVLDLHGGQRVADLGAGGGYFTYRLARAVGSEGRVYAVDTDSDMRARIEALAVRKGYSNIVTVEPREDEVGLPPVDRVLIVNAFHHLPDARASYFQGLARALQPGGRVAVIEARPRWFLFGHATEPEQVRSILTAAGYTAIGEYDFLPGQSFQVFEHVNDRSSPSSR